MYTTVYSDSSRNSKSGCSRTVEKPTTRPILLVTLPLPASRASLCFFFTSYTFYSLPCVYLQHSCVHGGRIKCFLYGPRARLFCCSAQCCHGARCATVYIYMVGLVDFFHRTRIFRNRNTIRAYLHSL